MSKAISVVVFEDPEAWLREHLPDMTIDSVACVYPIEPFNPNYKTTYEDCEENKKSEHNMNDHIEALKLLVNNIASKKLFVGGIKNPLDLVDPCNWDVEVVDAYYQLVMYKKILYG